MSEKPANLPSRPGASQPKPVPVRPKPVSAGAAPRNAAGQQAMKDKARNASAANEEDDEYEEDDSLVTAWVRQSPSWLASMVFHMVLLLVLALWALPQDVKDNLKEIVLGKPEVEENEELEETNEQLNEDVETEIDAENEEEVDDVVSPVDFKVESPEVKMKADADDMQLAASKIEFSDLALDSAVAGSLLTDLGGFADSGLGSRSSAGRSAAVRRGGGDAGSESAVEAALRWLANHQNYDGSWSWEHTPGGRCSGFPNPGNKKSKMGATGLALLPFLGAGYTHVDGKYQQTVGKGLRYLVGNMQVANNAGRLFEADGADHEHMYCHGIASCALAEAYGMTQDDKLKAPAQLSLNYIVQAQHPTNGGWLYTPRAGGDTSVVGWQIMALKSGILSYLQVPPHVKPLANKWLDFVQTDLPPGGYGIGSQYHYRAAGDRAGQPACTSIGLLCRNYLGTPKDDPGLKMGIEFLSKTGPSIGPNGPKDMYYNYYASMVMYQNDGPEGKMWKGWNGKMKPALVNSQVKKGAETGSWFFTGGGHGSGAGGRVYCTAMAAMALEVYYRYMPIYQKGNIEKDDFPLE